LGEGAHFSRSGIAVPGGMDQLAISGDGRRQASLFLAVGHLRWHAVQVYRDWTGVTDRETVTLELSRFRD